MPDIFGREPEDYELVQDLQDEKIWDRYQRANAIQRPWAAPTHDFQTPWESWGNGQVPQQFARASEDQQAIGYITNNLLALQTVADNILYTAYRLPQFLHLNTSVPEGARTYGVRIRNRVGQAQRITAPGFEAPSATASETIITQDMHWYGLDAEWSLDELRGAMFGGHPLDTESIDAAVTGTMETMEAVGLTGGNYAEKGLLNLGYDRRYGGRCQYARDALDDQRVRNGDAGGHPEADLRYDFQDHREHEGNFWVATSTPDARSICPAPRMTF